MQQEIAQAAESGVRRYNEMTPENERSPLQVAHAMRIGANEKLGRLNLKMSKLLAVANPANGQGFLQEVGSRHSHFILTIPGH